MASGNRIGRSRSPLRVENIPNRRDFKVQDFAKTHDMNNVMNQMMMNNMYQQGNMMMAGGMYPNMMMPGPMIGGGMMPSNSMDMIPTNGMELVPQPAPIDMPVMAGGSSLAPANPPAGMDMTMMGGMILDPAMMAMYDMSAMQPKKEINLKHCKLTPPDSGAPQQPRRARPPGCRTIFVGGLPDKIRESHVREIFEMYGRIQTLRLAKKNYCHIRFDRESCVDAAMAVSGYRLKLINNEKGSDDMDEDEDPHANSGWLHVDYALSRDDQNEFERRQRHALRAQQAQMQQMSAQQDIANRNLGTPNQRDEHEPSPPRIQPFTNVTIVQLAEKLKSEEHFAATLPTLIAWLERGECSKKNSNQFYSMIQATNSHVRRLFNEKIQAEDELQDCKEKVKNHIQKIIEQFEQVAKVFVAATHQRVWDHFTKPQRKNIETWQKMAAEFNALKEEFYDKFENEDTDFNGSYGVRNMDLSDDIQQLKRENESLLFQLEAYKNEIDVIKADAQKEMEKFKAQFIARQALQEAMEKKPPMPVSVRPPPPPPLPDDLDAKVHLKEVVEAGCGEAKLIGVISAFLQVHPQGASLDYVVSYVRALFSHVSQATVHHVLQKHNEVFRLTTTGVGANIENRWSFVAFENTK